MQPPAESDRELQRAAALIESDPDEAHKILIDRLNRDPDDAKALFVMARLYVHGGRFGIALHLMRQCTKLAPQKDAAWNDLGMVLSSIQRFREARDAFLEAIKRAPREAGHIANVAMTYLEESQWRKALDWAERALAIDPNLSGALQTKGFASLALGDWKAGWAGYDRALGGAYRKIIKVRDEPMWDGSRVNTLFVFGEQGIGDEIMMASCVPDAARAVGKVVLECDSRLEGLFRRSFPQCHVYGTRRAKSAAWVEDHVIDAGAGIGQLPKFFRPTPSSCPGTPYLVADPERRLQWRALLDSLGARPKIGICWSGGRRVTNAAGRAIGLEAFRALIEGVDADFVSLQYTKGAEQEIAATGLPVRHWPHAVATQDYDDVAALVAELDVVIGVNTAVQHLAGALGVPAIVLVPSRALWIWSTPGAEPGDMPWYRSVRRFHQRDGEPWAKTIGRLISDPEHLDRIRSARSGGVPRLHAEHHRDGVGTGGDQAAHAVVAQVVPAASERHEPVHHQPLSHPVPGRLPGLGAVHRQRHPAAA